MASRKQAAAPPPETYASAMDKLRDEMAKSSDRYTQVVGEYLTDYLLQHPEAEAALLDKGKSVKGSLETVRKEAQMVKVGNLAVLDDRTVFGIVLGYFGIAGTGSGQQGTGSAGEATPKTSPGAGAEAGEGGSPQSGGTKEVVPVTPATPDPFDLDALLGVM